MCIVDKNKEKQAQESEPLHRVKFMTAENSGRAPAGQNMTAKIAMVIFVEANAHAFMQSQCVGRAYA